MKRKGINWDNQPLGKTTDANLGRRLGVHYSTVTGARRFRNIPRFQRSKIAKVGKLKMLGKVPDIELAILAGVSESTIRIMRHQRGISAWQSHEKWDQEPLLGKCFDIELAEKYDCTISTVAAARNLREIPAYKEKRQCDCGEWYLARQRHQVVCSANCSNARHYAHKIGRPKGPYTALVAFKRTLKKKCVNRDPSHSGLEL